jgi:hypothetical protein
MKSVFAAKDAMHHKKLTPKDCCDLGLFVCGSAKTVKETLIGYLKDIRLGNLLALMQFGTLPGDLTRRSMERFAESVMPDLRKAARELYGEVTP